MAKVIDKINRHLSESPGKAFFSFEFFPPKTDAGVKNLFDRFDRMATLNPLWIDVTWGAGGSTADSTLDICIKALQYHSLDVMMHLTCTNMPKAQLHDALTKCKAAGICNILALRGDPPKDSVDWRACEGGFTHASDLVKYIRDEFGDYFCIGVAGYPEGHLESESLEEDIAHLKTKVDNGADLIVTQLFYDIQAFVDFSERCKLAGITVPIIPGIMPIQSYQGFQRMTSFCKTKVPQYITDCLDPISHDEQAVKDQGVNIAVEMCSELISKGVPGLHFYTLNLETTTMRIIDKLQLFDAHAAQRQMPWRKATTTDRSQEDVRPIFWSNRQKSYIQRTATWDDFPNGRFGNRASPAFGDFNFVSMCGISTERQCAESRAMWGESLGSVDDVLIVFEKFLKGDVKRLPWCDAAPAAETNFIAHQLKKLIRSGLMTINSQPRVNAGLSNDPYVGWGPEGGFVYQKAYVEFFCPPSILERIIESVEASSWLSYCAVNMEGAVRSNVPMDSVNAITWGVFPHREIVQPTITDVLSFLAWKDEAFGLWAEWEALYEEGSASRDIVVGIQREYFLVNIVDNNFVSGDLFGDLIKAVA